MWNIMSQVEKDSRGKGSWHLIEPGIFFQCSGDSMKNSAFHTHGVIPPKIQLVPGASCGLGPLTRISFFCAAFLPYTEEQKAIVF